MQRQQFYHFSEVTKNLWFRLCICVLACIWLLCASHIERYSNCDYSVWCFCSLHSYTLSAMYILTMWIDALPAIRITGKKTVFVCVCVYCEESKIKWNSLFCVGFVSPCILQIELCQRSLYGKSLRISIHSFCMLCVIRVLTCYFVLYLTSYG